MRRPPDVPVPDSARYGPLQLWGGIECSNIRIGNNWRDQVRETGHHDRGTADIARLAAIGLRTLRYPVLWERDGDEPEGRRWHDQQLAALQDCGVEVVAGLLHHGSGPRSTDLLDPALGEKLAAYAATIADRYPFITAWTPVNEPLTTARFACLYGHWYPHARDEGMFLRALFGQCRAALLAMRAIRSRISGARFVHTEDLGRVFSTPPLAAQARYENDRRWLSLDLLCGRVGPDHAWRGAFEASGVPSRHLDELATGEAAPDLVGINHYVTSDRFLDHRLHLYPPHLHGGNGRQRYADTEAVRAKLPDGATGWEPRLREAWARYQRPMVVAEAHLGCDDPEESLRWLMEAWGAALSLRAGGADIRAVTAWALFGSVDWDTMVCEHRGRLERGALDVACDPPRETLLARAITALAHEGAFTHAALASPGWWRRDDRLLPELRALELAGGTAGCW